MSDKNESLMPEENDTHERDDISFSIAKKINDDIEDSSILRSWRKWFSAGAIVLAILLYFILGKAVFKVINHPDIFENIQYLAVTTLIILAFIPTLIILQVSKAIYGKGASDNQSYSPIQSVLKLLKELKE